MNNYEIMKAYIENTPAVGKALAADLLRQAIKDDLMREAKTQEERLIEAFKSKIICKN